MRAAKEKTIQCLTTIMLFLIAALCVVPVAATANVVKPTTVYDFFTTRNSEKPPIGTSENIRCIVVVGINLKPVPALRLTVVELRRSPRARGMMYFRARYYDPLTGEFTSRDPLEYVDGASLYRGYFVPNGVDSSGTVLKVINKPDFFVVLLNQLCPEGQFNFIGGLIVAPDGFCEDSVEYGWRIHYTHCWGLGYPYRGVTTRTRRRVASATHKVSCQCICDAIKSDRIITLESVPNRGGGPATVPRPLGGLGPLPPRDENNKVINFYDHVEIDPFDPTVINGLPGIGDSTLPGKQRVRDPLWLILGHELCGHAVPNQPHIFDGTEYTSADPVIVIENQIRAEHSTAGNNFGRRGRDLRVPGRVPFLR